MQKRLNNTAFDAYLLLTRYTFTCGLTTQRIISVCVLATHALHPYVYPLLVPLFCEP